MYGNVDIAKQKATLTASRKNWGAGGCAKYGMGLQERRGDFLPYTLLYTWILNHVNVLLCFKK